MPDLELSILIEDDFIGLVSEKWLRRVVSATLSACGVERPVEMGIVMAGDSTVRDLNRTYRSVDDTTDVLAFALSQPAGNRNGQFIMPPEEIAHLGEIIIWTGWAIATWSLPGLAFALWTAANLIPRAQANHRWYQNHFPDYPAKRKTLFPGLW